MYTICTKDEWRDKYFDPYYCEVEYGVFWHYGVARMRADEIDGVVIQLDDDIKKRKEK